MARLIFTFKSKRPKTNDLEQPLPLRGGAMLILPATIDVITTIQARYEPFFDLIFVFAYPTKLVPSVPLRT